MHRFALLFGFVLVTGCAHLPPAAPRPSPTLVPTFTPAAQPTETTPARRIALPDPASATWKDALSGFTRPLTLTNAGDDRVFVVEQRGLIWAVDWGQNNPQIFLDIRDRVNDRANEQGLLGLAFHPDFSENGRFFVNYSGVNGETIIAEYRAETNRNGGNRESERALLRIDQPYTNHNGGALAFGPDGYLYIGTGDGGSGGDPHGNGQRLDTLLGKILRIDVDTGEPYSIPQDNPFTDGGGQPEIWLYGLRNPWRIAFDRTTGDLFIADVGQNQWEEINFLPAGTVGAINYGWNLREGAHDYSGGGADALVDPVAEYDHSLGCSVTGGVVVRDSLLPAWQGVYLYGDYCSGRVWGLIQDESGAWLSAPLYEVTGTISSFGEDHAGRVYLVDHNGAILRLEPAP
ncbi:MAG: glucose dehydrogenase [Anaerolineales bacterium]|nr:MAG: glucose dehydrogenase [Anaerolineales bacterium]